MKHSFRNFIRKINKHLTKKIYFLFLLQVQKAKLSVQFLTFSNIINHDVKVHYHITKFYLRSFRILKENHI